jgi:hypothetical protein
MVIFNSYVKLPEGSTFNFTERLGDTWWIPMKPLLSWLKATLSLACCTFPRHGCNGDPTNHNKIRQKPRKCAKEYCFRFEHFETVFLKQYPKMSKFPFWNHSLFDIICFQWEFQIRLSPAQGQRSQHVMLLRIFYFVNIVGSVIVACGICGDGSMI